MIDTSHTKKRYFFDLYGQPIKSKQLGPLGIIRGHKLGPETRIIKFRRLYPQSKYGKGDFGSRL